MSDTEDAFCDKVQVTQRLAQFANNTQWVDIPDSVKHEAKRSLLNYFACAIAGSGQSVVEKNLAVLAAYAGNQHCDLIGRNQRADMPLASYINAMSANVFDFDDTHQPTVIHPTAPIAPALFAFTQTQECDGQSLLTAFVVGGEIECRIGKALSPSHYARGWHITSTCGIFAAAAGVGKLLQLNDEQHANALANASAQAAGLVETLGTMAKSISVGNAARNGLLSALLANNGVGGPADPLYGDRGFLRVFSDQATVEPLFDQLGEDWQIATNTYKPYPTGIVLHPVIDACMELMATKSIRSEDVNQVGLHAHPLLQERTDRPDVTTGRLSQVSAQHTIAIVLRRGKAGLNEFDDAAAAETLNDGIRPDITFIGDPDRAVDSVTMRVLTQQGQSHEVHINASTGGPMNPMTDDELEKKLINMCAYRGLGLDTGRIADIVWNLDSASDASVIMNLVRTGGATL